MSQDPNRIHLEQIAAQTPLRGLRVADIGCGKGELVRLLAGEADDVVGIECSDSQLAAARAADPGQPGRYLQGVAENMPLADAACDLVVFCYSLHHVPLAAMDQALREAARVLAPDGRLCVLEPLAQGPAYALDRLIDDEKPVRAAAQKALDLDPGLRETGRAVYQTEYDYASAAALIAEMLAVDPAREPQAEANRAEVERRFASLGQPCGIGRRFVQPNLIRQFRLRG